MATQRLTNSLRDDIRKALIINRFQDDAAAILKEAQEMALEVYHFTYDKPLLRRMKNMPDGFLCKDNDVDVNIGGQFHQLPFNGNITWGWLRKFDLEQPDGIEKICAYKYKNGRIVLDVDSDIAIKVLNLAEKRSEFDEKVSRAIATTDAALSSVTTVKKLITIWPEVQPFIPGCAIAGKTNPTHALPPAIRREDLNAALDLPVEA